jgi:hypothetical protein
VFARDLHFQLKDRENTFLENVVNCIPEYMTLHSLLFYLEDGGSMLL